MSNDERPSWRALAPAQAVLDFWFGAPDDPGHASSRPQWFVKDAAFDASIAQRFGAVIEQALAGALTGWADQPLTAPADKPLGALADKPLAALADKPLAALADQPLAAPADQPLAAPADKPLGAQADKPLVVPADKPLAALALVIVLDQFTRNVFRDQARAFAGDAMALATARALVASGADLGLTGVQRQFVYLPFEHAEDLNTQRDSLRLFEQLEHDQPALKGLLDWAKRHHDIIARFGRFPHRNAALGRASSAEELAFLQTPGSGF